MRTSAASAKSRTLLPQKPGPGTIARAVYDRLEENFRLPVHLDDLSARQRAGAINYLRTIFGMNITRIAQGNARGRGQAPALYVLERDPASDSETGVAAE